MLNNLLGNLCNADNPNFKYKDLVLVYSPDEKVIRGFLEEYPEIVLPMLSWMKLGTVYDGMKEAVAVVFEGKEPEPDEVVEPNDESEGSELLDLVKSAITGALDELLEKIEQSEAQQKPEQAQPEAQQQPEQAQPEVEQQPEQAQQQPKKEFKPQSMVNRVHSEKPKVCEYIKIPITEDLSLRYIIQFDDRKNYECKWFLKAHATKSWTQLDEVGLNNLWLAVPDKTTYQRIRGFTVSNKRLQLVTSYTKGSETSVALIEE